MFLDGLDGRIARMTNTTSDFGREMDSLADVISFGMAPAVLAFAWGVQFIEIPAGGSADGRTACQRGLFHLLPVPAVRRGAAGPLQHQKNPVPKNPGRPDRKYFVGLPIPAAAAMVAAVVYAEGSAPLRWWVPAVLWLALLGLLAYLMVSTWRYPSFKGVNLSRPRSPLIIVLLASLIYLIWMAPQPVLLVMGVAYVGSGIATRLGGVLRRLFRRSRAIEPERQAG